MDLFRLRSFLALFLFCCLFLSLLSLCLGVWCLYAVLCLSVVCLSPCLPDCRPQCSLLRLPLDFFFRKRSKFGNSTKIVLLGSFLIYMETLGSSAPSVTMRSRGL